MMNLKDSPKILLVAQSGIGNLIMQYPAIKLLRQTFPAAHITLWVAPRGTKTLALAMPEINSIIEAPIKQSVLAQMVLVHRLRQEKYDVGIVLSPGQHIKSAIYLFLAGIPIRIGETYPFLASKHSKLFLTNGVTPTHPHDLEINISLLESLNITLPAQPLRYSLSLPAEYTIQAEEYWISNNFTKKPVIGFHLGSASGFAWKRWPVDYFIQLGQWLHTTYGATLLLFGGPDETDLKQQVVDALPAITMPISNDLLATGALMKKCQLVVSNDSGLMHLAAALNAPVLGLFGPTDERKTGPRGINSHSLRAPNTSPIYDTDSNFDLGSSPHASLNQLTPALVQEYISNHFKLA